MYVPCSLNGLKRFLKRNPCAFYNYPDLLCDIQEHYWKYEDETKTRENTDKNAKYMRCKIVYKMHRKRKSCDGDNNQVPAYTPSKVRFLKEVRDIEDCAPSQSRKNSQIASYAPILKKALPSIDAELDVVQSVYVTCRMPSRKPSIFKYF